jgi:serine/threonine protein phosphatase PrpC
MLPSLPLFVIHEGRETFPNDGNFRTHLCTLHDDLSGALRGSANLCLRVFEAGRSLPATADPRLFKERIGDRHSYEVDLGSVFDRIISELARASWYYPEVLVFLRTMPSGDSRRAWEKLIQRRVVVATYCCPWEGMGGEERSRLETLLFDIAKVSNGQAPYKILSAEEWRLERLENIFTKLRERILARRPPGKEMGSRSSERSDFGPTRGDSGAHWGGGPFFFQPPQAPVAATRADTTRWSPPVEQSVPPVIAQWEVHEPPAELEDRRAHEVCEERETSGGWWLIGASVRGKLHAHEATFREDSFALGSVPGWNLVAVADGAGSHSLSRVGSELAAKAAIAEMERLLGAASVPGPALVGSVMQEALGAAWRRLRAEAEQRPRPFEDFGTTLLLLAHHLETGWLGVAQVGDGLLAAQLEDGELRLLGSPQTGEYSGQTSFLTNYLEADLAKRAEVTRLERAPQLFLIMTDGVADDLYPPEQKLPKLIEPLSEVLTQADRPRALLKLISYDLPGSFDDRTLVAVCRPQDLILGERPSTQMTAADPPPPAGEAEPNSAFKD